MSRWLVVLVVFATALTWAVTIAVLGFPTNWWSALKPFVSAITVAGLILGIYVHWAWRFWGVRAWIANTPDISGAWQMELQSEWKDPATGERKPLISGFAQVDQSANSFCLRLFTEEARSKSIAYSFSEDQSVHDLSIVYENKPNIALRMNRSRFHQGAATFSVRGYYPDRVEGEYWTERETIGTLRLINRKRKAVNSFQDGLDLYNK